MTDTSLNSNSLLEYKLTKRIVIGTSYLLVCLTFNYFAGILNFDPTIYDTVTGKDTGASIALPLISCFAYVGFYLSKNAVASVCFSLSTKREKFKRSFFIHLRGVLVRRGHAHDRKVLWIAIIFASSYLLWHELTWLAELNPLQNSLRLILLLQTVIFWFVTFRLLWSVYDTTSFLAAYIRRKARLQLFQLESLKPITLAVVINFVAPMFILGLQPLFWLHSSPPEMDLVFIGFIVVITLFFIAQPIRQIHNILETKKELSIERINDSIDSALARNGKKNRRLVDSDERLQYISDLLVVRKEIASAPTWPIDLPFVARIMVLIAIPFMGWVASSMIDNLVKSFL